jgi:RNA polymerase sigma-70 factor (ECF subfamily)
MRDKEKTIIFEGAYDSYAEAIFRFVYFKVSDHEVARDITAETFLKFWKRLSSDEEIENSRALLYTIAKGQVIDYYRQNKKERNISIDKVKEDLIDTTQPEEKVYANERIVEMFGKLDKVKKEYKEVLMLHYVEELKINEIATILEKQESTVRVLVHRALNALRSQYE